MTFQTTLFQKPAAWLATLICLAPLSGCLTTPVSSIVKLSQLSPLEAVPSDMRFAVRSPQFLRVRDGDITVSMSFKADNDAQSIVEVYKPIIDENAIPGQGISIGTQDGSRLAIAKFSDADAASMAALQTKIKSLRASGVKGEGSFSVGATGCTTGTLPDGPILLTTWLRTTSSEDYFILTRNVDLRSVFSKSNNSIEDLQPCD